MTNGLDIDERCARINNTERKFVACVESTLSLLLMEHVLLFGLEISLKNL